MTRTPNIQHNATSLILPAVRAVACSGELESFGCNPCAVRNMLYYNAFKALPFQRRAKPRQNAEVGRGFFGGGMQDALVDPLNYTVEILSGQDYTVMAGDLQDMLGRSIECTDMQMQYVSMEQRLVSIEDSRHHNNFEDNRYIYHSDHLGSSAFLTDASGTPTQHLQYLPFGEPFIEQRSVTDYYTPYTFSAKERDLETGYSYFGARYYSSNLSIWLSVDPMSDKYPSMSPYMYCAGNPIILVDPDGRDIVIWYTDSDNSTKSFSFNGKNASEAPNNEFVQSVLNAYEYNVKNGGGKRMQAAAADSNLKLNVYKRNVSRAGVSLNGHAIFWNPVGGLLTEQGDVLSPATLLEHEIDHELYKYEVGILEFNKGLYTPDKQYGNAEERRVITGSEKHTGTRNGEFKRSKQRTAHAGATVIVPNSTSTKADKKKSIEYWQNQDKNSPHGFDISSKLRLINKYLK